MPPERRRATLLVVDSSGRILLFQFGRKPGETYWATPGGGLEAGESFHDAAVREAHEELGLSAPTLVALGGRTVTLPLAGVPVLQAERLFLLRVQSLSFDQMVRDAHAREGILASRWWSSEELAATSEIIYPENLIALVTRALAQA